ADPRRRNADFAGAPCQHQCMASATPPGRLRHDFAQFVEALRRGDTYGLLLVLLMVTYVLIALLERSPWERFVIAFTLGLVFLLTLHTSHVRTRAFHVGLAIVLIIELSTFVQALVGREGNDGNAYIIFVFLLIAPLVILSRILRHDVIGMETILGALCVYVLLGIAFAGIYAAINDVEAGRVFSPPRPQTKTTHPPLSFLSPP